MEMRDVVGFEGLYKVTDDGRVWSVPRKDRRGNQCGGRWIKCRQKPATPHRRVNLYRGGVSTTRLLHQLVLEAFIGPRPEGMECRHLNGDAAANQLENLVWGTRAENAQDALDHGTVARGEGNGQHKLTEQEVKEIRWIASQGVLQRVIGESFGVGRTAITKIVNRKKWKHIA